MIKKDLGEASAVAVRVSTLAHHAGHAALIASGWFFYKASQFTGLSGVVYQDRAWLWLGVGLGAWVVSYLAIGRKPWHFTLAVSR